MKNNPKSGPFNIVIIPPKQISNKAAAISKKFKRQGCLFVLDKQHSPHITLYMTEFPLKNIPAVKNSLQQITSAIKPFRIKSSNYRQNSGYIDISYQKSKSVKNLQKKIIAILNLLREGCVKAGDKAKTNRLSALQNKNVELYGYRDVGQNFFPHLTFTKLKNNDGSALNKIKKQDFSFKVNKIGLFYLGQYGTCRKLVEDWQIN